MHYRDDDEDSNDDFMGNMSGYDTQSNPLGLSKAELRKVRSGNACSVIFSSDNTNRKIPFAICSAEQQADYGEETARPHQQLSERAENADPGGAQERREYCQRSAVVSVNDERTITNVKCTRETQPDNIFPSGQIGRGPLKPLCADRIAFGASTDNYYYCARITLATDAFRTSDDEKKNNRRSRTEQTPQTHHHREFFMVEAYSDFFVCLRFRSRVRTYN